MQVHNLSMEADHAEIIRVEGLITVGPLRFIT
jgi:hypothetical protein